MRTTAAKDTADINPIETREWLESLDYVLESGGPLRVGRLLRDARDPRAPGRRQAAVHRQHALHQHHPARASRCRCRAAARSSAASRASCAGTRWRWSCAPTGARTASAATSRPTPRPRRSTRSASTTSSAGAATTGATATSSSSRATPRPGIYARAFLEGRLSDEQLENFRRELKPGGGLSSYPHPWLMPDFWEFPTVSMGLGPIMAIYQARFIRYLEDRGLKTGPRPEGLGVPRRRRDRRAGSRSARSRSPSREKLDNLIFVINCNLQRLDGPVRGNGQIIQELEAIFRGAGWNVIKVLWGREWDRAAREGPRRPARASAWARSSTASIRSTPSRPARTSASTSGAPTRGCSTWSSTSPTTS